jgi:hypothetical protein
MDCQSCKEKDLQMKVLEIRIKVMTDLMNNIRQQLGLDNGDSILIGLENIRHKPIDIRLIDQVSNKDPDKPYDKNSTGRLSKEDRKFLINVATDLGMQFNDHSSYRILTYIEYQIKYVLPKQGRQLPDNILQRVNELYKRVTNADIVFED